MATIETLSHTKADPMPALLRLVPSVEGERTLIQLTVADILAPQRVAARQDIASYINNIRDNDPVRTTAQFQAFSSAIMGFERRELHPSETSEIRKLDAKLVVMAELANVGEESRLHERTRWGTIQHDLYHTYPNIRHAMLNNGVNAATVDVIEERILKRFPYIRDALTTADLGGEIRDATEALYLENLIVNLRAAQIETEVRGGPGDLVTANKLKIRIQEALERRNTIGENVLSAPVARAVLRPARRQAIKDYNHRGNRRLMRRVKKAASSFSWMS